MITRWMGIGALLIVASVAYAGGWVSSGGGSFRDEHNPWFVRNTTSVNYCVQVANQSVSASSDTIHQAISDAFQYWKTEFNKVPATGTSGSFQLGMQNFSEVPCSANPDIRFLVGYETLGTAELNFLKDPTKYIGVTVRTDYDEVQLKGKGFVYISSDLGPHAYDNPGTKIEKAWQQKKLLTYALLHETGHIFGFPHMGSGLMSEVFLDQLIAKENVGDMLKYPIESFMRPDSTITLCNGLPMEAKSFFTMPDAATCLQLKLTANPVADVDVFSLIDENATPVKLGSLKGLSLQIADLRADVGPTLQLTAQQTVFTSTETAFRSFMFGPFLLSYAANGTFMINGMTRPPAPIYLRLTPNSLTLLGTVKNKITPVFSYLTPTGVTRLINPIP
jgi:hypothetical protein